MSLGRGDVRPVSPTAVAYCRAARRLRGRLSGRPVRLHRALRELGVSEAPAPRTGRVATDPLSVAGGFAAEVARRMDGPILRLAQRRALLAAAHRMGIGRFEANLVIAAVQHERRAEARPHLPVSAATDALVVHWTGPALLAATLQALIAWGAWRVWCG